MKRITLITLLVAVAASLSLSSCKRYASIWTGEWQVVKVDEQVVLGDTYGVLHMNEDNEYRYVDRVYTSTAVVDHIREGIFTNQGDSIYFHDRSSETTQAMEVLTINNNEMILRGVLNNSGRNEEEPVTVMFERISYEW